jgi:hypothetical protein
MSTTFAQQEDFFYGCLKLGVICMKIFQTKFNLNVVQKRLAGLQNVQQADSVIVLTVQKGASVLFRKGGCLI